MAGPPELHLPLDCELGQTCYIEDYVDLRPGDGQQDYTCGIKSRDGHRGTDILLDSFEAMERGVSVLAAAPGHVSAIRDNMIDRAVTDETRAQIEGRECGNAVRIDHGDGWQTLYCHMKRGSIIVQKGDRVDVGTPLGQVGLSGLTNVPHVHLGVLKDGNQVDPFRPDGGQACNAGDVAETLWASPPPYTPSGLFTAGFSSSVPSFDDVKSGAARKTVIQADQPLVLYGHVFHARPGDTLFLRAKGPEGTVFDEIIHLEDPKLQFFNAFGRRSPAGGWPTGDYRGIVRLERSGELIAWRHADITVSR